MFLSFLSKDFLRCVTASIIFFIISIIAVSKYVDGSSKAAGVKLKVWIALWPTPPQFMYYFVTSFSLCWYQMSFFSQVFGFIATIVFALDFYFIFNELANFLKEGGESNVESSRQQGNTNYVLIYERIVWSNVCFSHIKKYMCWYASEMYCQYMIFKYELHTHIFEI